MQVVRIGDKVVSVGRITRVVEEVLRLRAQGLPQAEVAARLGLDRAWVSRLESLGEIRKGRAIAVIGMPIANRAEVGALCRELGVEFVWLMSDQERRAFAESLSGAQLIDHILTLAADVRQYDAVILMASDERVKLLEVLLQPERVVPIVLGPTPLNHDVVVDLDLLRDVVEGIRAPENG
jgi:DNA-binding transcriptional regulator LsrR (DeoR family)